MSITDDIYIPRPAHALPPLPGEHSEAVDLDLATKSGTIVVLGGRITVWEPSRTVFVGVVYSSTLSRSDASSALLGAVRDGRVGSDVVRAAVERGFAVRGYGEES